MWGFEGGSMKLARQFHSYVRLGRLHTAGATMTTVLTGAYATSGFVEQTIILKLLLMGFLAHYIGFGLNEYMDRHLDSLSPDPEVRAKPLVSGEISPRDALSSMAIAGALYTLFSAIFFPNPKTSFLFLLGLLSGIFYDVKGKRTPYLYDFSLSLTMALSVLAGASAVGSPTNPLVLVVATLVFFQTTIMNGVQGAMKDVENDRLGNVPTRAVAWNFDLTKELKLKDTMYLYYLVLMITFLVIYLFPFFLGYVTSNYLWILIIFGIPIQIYVFRSLLGRHDRDYYLKVFAIHNIITANLVISVLYDSLGLWGFLIMWLFPTFWYIISVPVIYKDSHPLKPGV